MPKNLSSNLKRNFAFSQSPFLYPLRKKARGFLTFPEGTETEHWSEIGYKMLYNI